MGKQVIRYRTCDKCAGKGRDVEAAVTDKVTFNGSRYDLDLCETHSLELFGAMMLWLDLGTKTGETGIFDRQQQARQVTVAVDKPKPAAPVFDLELHEEPEDAASTPVVPLRPVIAGDPDLPATAARWTLTRHAEQRLDERHYTLAEVLWAAERPEWTVPSKQDPTLEQRRRGSCKVIVDPQENIVITVIDKDEDDRSAFLADFLNRKAQV